MCELSEISTNSDESELVGCSKSFVLVVFEALAVASDVDSAVPLTTLKSVMYP